MTIIERDAHHAKSGVPRMYAGLIPALNTLSASRWTLLCARLFGEKLSTNDEFGNLIECHRWRGKTYFTRLIE